MKVRAAGIDCGTMSIRLLIADVDTKTRVARDVERAMTIVRLGEGVDATGRLAPVAMARAVEVLDDYARRCAQAEVEEIRVVATSATRDAGNAAEFAEAVRATVGAEPEVVDGAAEAALTFAGAAAVAAGRDPVLVVDLGGGSTELILGQNSPPAISSSFSMDVGCVRMTERHLRADPPASCEVEAAAGDVDSWLDAAGRVVDLGAAHTVVGVAGTITTLAAVALGLPEYDPAAVHGSDIAVEEMTAACRRMWTAPRSEIAALPCVQPGRAEVLGGGALVWSRVVERIRAATRAAGRELTRVTISEHDILDGITMTAAARKHARRPPLP